MGHQSFAKHYAFFIWLATHQCPSCSPGGREEDARSILSMDGLLHWLDARPERLWIILGIHSVVVIALLVALCELLDII